MDMIHRSVVRRVVLILVVAVFMGFAINPKPFGTLDIPVIGPVWNWLQESRVHLGLDLQGGTQLDYEIDLSEAQQRNADDITENDVDIEELVQGVQEVIEKRVNGLGVSEPNIYLADIGTEKHIIVELPGIKDIREAKEKVGKVVTLEFKTQRAEPDPHEVELIRSSANELLPKLLSMSTVTDLSDASSDYLRPGRVEVKEEKKVYKDELPVQIADVLDRLKPGVVFPELIEASEGYIYTQDGLQEQKGFNILLLRESGPELRKKPVAAEDFNKVAEELSDRPYDEASMALDELPKALRKVVDGLEEGDVTDVAGGDEGFSIAKVNKIIPSSEEEWQVRARHILFKTAPEVPLKSTKSLQQVPDGATDEERVKIEAEDEAIRKDNEKIDAENKKISDENDQIRIRNESVQKKALGILDEIKKNPDLFVQKAKEFSQDSNNAGNGGDLGYFGPGKMALPFEEAVKKLDEGDFTSELVESEFGYHIIQLLDRKDPDETLYQLNVLHLCYSGADGCESVRTREEAQVIADSALRRVREEMAYSLDRVWFSTFPDPWEKTNLDGRFFKRADVNYDQTTFRPYVSISFDTEGAELFERLTEENVGKPLAIFVGGELISAPRVDEKIAGGQAQITLGITDPQEALREANELARNLNAGAIPAPLKKPNELHIGASLGNDALQKSFSAGLIGLVILCLFMIGYYRLLGVIACLSLGLYGVFLLFFIQSAIPAAIAYPLTALAWLALAAHLFTSRLDGWSKLMYLVLSIFGIFFAGAAMANPIVLTLAGVAGVILSIGMAVDANILIFERVKEELALGRSFLSAIETGFDRAWSSILDSNVSTLITCGILFFFGSSIIKGFAFNLALGVLISMFTAVTVTKLFLLLFSGTRLENKRWLWRR